MDQAKLFDQLNKLDHREIMEVAKVSPAIHFSTCISIQNKKGETIRPLANILQLRMSEVYELFQELDRPLRMITCKPRQVGCSTFAQHIVYNHARNNTTRALVVADKLDNSADLMAKAEGYEQTDDYDWGQTMRVANNEIRFSNGSVIEIDTAESPKAGISKTRQAFHASEVTKWPRGGKKSDAKTMAAILPSVSKVSASVAIAESTPDGASGWFYETYQKAWTIDEFLEALEKGRDPGIVWIKVFAAWFEFEEHRMEVTPTESYRIMNSLNKREQDGVLRYGWEPEQIAWRRSTMVSDCAGSEDSFDEYYPEDETSCFLASGSPRFSMVGISLMENDSKSMVKESGFLITQENGSVTWNAEPGDNGDVELYEHPMVGCRYLVACDPATGEDQTQSKDPDRTSVQVWRQGYYCNRANLERPAKMVARIRSPYYGDGDEVAGAITRFSNYYGGAIVVLEVNMGLHVLELLKLEGVHLYRRLVLNARLGGEKTEQYGFKLKDREIRRALIQALATAIREGVIEVPSSDWYREAKAFITSHNGRDEARAGEHDDDILCSAMAWYCIGAASEYKDAPRRRRKPADFKDWKVVGSTKKRW